MHTFPLAVHASGRYLVDSSAVPKPWHPRIYAAWSAIANLTATERAIFFSLLVSYGYTGILVSLIEHKFTSSYPPKNRAGNLPFSGRLDGGTFTGTPNGNTNAFSIPSGNDGQYGTADDYAGSGANTIANAAPNFTTPNLTFFAEAKAFIDDAAAWGLVVVLFPGFLGFDMFDHGWMNEVEQNFLRTGWGGLSGQSFANNSWTFIKNYGAFVADYLKTCPNLIWAHQGDYGLDLGSGHAITTQQLNAVKDLLAGIESVSARQSVINTSEGARWGAGSISQDTPLTPTRLSGVYTGPQPAVDVFRAFNASPTVPYFHIENVYNGATGSPNGGSAPWRQYVWRAAILGAGVCYGDDSGSGTSGPTWMLPSLVYGDFATYLGARGNPDAGICNAFFSLVPWYKCLPSTSLVTAHGHTTSDDTYIGGSIATDGTVAYLYVPPAWAAVGDATFTVDLSPMVGPCRAQWLNPFTGAFTLIGTVPNASQAFTPPGSNGDGTDWVLLIDFLGTTVATVAGRSIVTNRIKGSGAEPKFIAWGTGAGNSLPTDTTLFTEASEPRVSGTSSQQTTTTTGDTYRVTGTMTVAGSAKDITNAGLFDASSSGNLFVKRDFPAVHLDVGDSLQLTFNVQLV